MEQPQLNVETMNETDFHRALARGRRDFRQVVFTSEIYWPANTEQEGRYDFSNAQFTHNFNIGDMKLWGTLHLLGAQFDQGFHVFRSNIVSLNLTSAVCTGPMSMMNTTWFHSLRLAHTVCGSQLWIEPKECQQLDLLGTNSAKTFISRERLQLAVTDRNTELGEVLTPKQTVATTTQ